MERAVRGWSALHAIDYILNLLVRLSPSTAKSRGWPEGCGDGSRGRGGGGVGQRTERRAEPRLELRAAAAGDGGARGAAGQKLYEGSTS